MSGLCLRKHVFSQDPTRTEFEADVSFSLERVGDVRRRLDDLSGAGVAYAEAARIRQRLMNSVPDNTQYVSNYADTLQKIAEFNWYLEDMKIGLAFQDAVVDSAQDGRQAFAVRCEGSGIARKGAAKGRGFSAPNGGKKLSGVGFIEEWWRSPVADRLALFERHRHDAKENPGKCMGDVLKVLDKVTSEASSASTR